MLDEGSHPMRRRWLRRAPGIAAVLFAFALGTLVAGEAVQAKDKEGVCYVTTKTGYPGDDAPAGAIAKWMAAGARAAGLPGELPVMASLVESGLRNLDFGDADSAGYFQMRAPLWNQGEYQGYAENPDLQLKWFIDHAILFKQLRFAAGITNLVDDSSAWGEWIADIERPAEQYRGLYQLRLEEARQLLASK
jgi:hypothetical protein